MIKHPDDNIYKFSFYKKLLYFLVTIFIYFSLCVGHLSATNKEKESEFTSDFKDALKEILTERVLGRIEADRHKKDIHKKVKKEVRGKLFRDSTKHVKNKAYGRNKPLALEGLRDNFFLYKLPTWPFHSLPYLKRGILQIKTDFDFADKSYSSNGQKQDLSSLIFRQNDIYLRDILAVSRLLEDRSLGPIQTPLAENYLYMLAGQQIKFDASMNKQTFLINYAHHVHHGDFSFGVQFPLVRRQNEIKLVSALSAATRAELSSINSPRTKFFDLYNDLEGFFEDILNRKGISFNRKDAEIGVGDPSLFLNFEFDWNFCERFVVGVNFIFGLSGQRDTKKLWDPELGNGGFHKVEAFSSILFAQDRFFNPHIHLKVSSSIPATVKRRVPKIILYNQTDPLPNSTSASDRFLFGNEAIYRDVNITATNGVDSKVRRFGKDVSRINITPGPELFLRFGNIFERFLWRRGFLDLFYDIRLKGKDYVGFWVDSANYDTSIVTHNSWQVEHMAGFSYNHQLDENFRFGLGGIYSFAGRNVPRMGHINAFLNIEF